MTIIFNGHSFKYEVENICKLFFTSELFKHVYDAEKIDFQDDVIVTRLKKGKTKTSLLVIAKIKDKLVKKHKFVFNNEGNYEDECERLLSIAVYECLKEITNIDVSWGIMTGIRPVKQMNYMIEKGNSIEEAKKIFKEKFLVSDVKIELCENTLKNQMPIIESSKPNSYSLYVSIPFCPSRCSYCSFVSSSIANKKALDLLDSYLDNLCREIEYVGNIVKDKNLSLETVYVGGGTPTTLSAVQLDKLLNCMCDNFPVSCAREFTVEAGRADTITKEKLLVIKKYGATRISINPQTFNDSVLQKIGRKHTANDVIECYDMAKQIGFDDINMDFIAGLPSDTYESFCETIDKAIELSPTNITVHTLTVKRSSDLFNSDGLDNSISQKNISDMVDYAYDKLTKNGYLPYYLYRQKNTLQNLENIGYCKKGYEGLYNIFIMEEIHTILAMGASAVSKLIRKKSQKVKRIFNYKYPFEYNNNFEEMIKRKDEINDFYTL